MASDLFGHGKEIQHLNNTGCAIRSTPDKGRGLYASRFIPRNTVIDISPILLFSKEEYEEHGKHTVLDHYTFIWTEGRMALALGLGSLFNHDESPNVSYSLDIKSDCIRYTTTRDINIGEELCIYYGHKLWFAPADDVVKRDAIEADDGWGGLATVVMDGPSEESKPTNPYAEGDQDEVIPEVDLPFVRFKLPPEEEDADSIRTFDAWVVDVPEPKHITTLLKWLKQAGLDGPELGHLKRIRKQKDSATPTLLLCTTSETPQLPADLDLPAPYILSVPTSPALTLPSLELKSALWPTMYTPRRKDEPEEWTRGKLRWAWDAMQRALDAASRAHSENEELPIAALIPMPYGAIPAVDDKATYSTSLSFAASDTRHSTQHLLRHAAINVVRKMADFRASQDAESATMADKLITPMSNLAEAEAEESRNGSNYLLTDRTFFITHEPCIMCSMALLHSRVKEVVYFYPMTQTGGCGGCTCLPTLKGVNHRFSVLKWKLDELQHSSFVQKDLKLDATIDA